MNLFERFNLQKERVKQIADEFLKEQYLTKAEFDEIISKLEKDKIKIGVVGQIKNGKTTLLNSLIFNKPVLPAATTPMTASLSYVTFGKGEVEVEFYTKEDWGEILELAKQEGEKEKIISARELVEQADKIKNDIEKLLGSKKSIKFSEIKDYVGEGGKYVPITKALIIKHPHQTLKNADFVDTPGFNDPVISRENRTKEFLSEADVVIVILYAGRPFDAQDKDLVFNRISTVGIGKVIIALNKIDVVLGDEGGKEKAIKYANEKYQDEIRKIEKENPIITDILKSAEVIPISSLWALFGRMKEEDILRDEDLKFYYEKYKNDFPQLKKPEDFVKESGLIELEKQIEIILKKQKFEILIKKPITFILGKLKSKDNELREEFHAFEIEEKSLNKTLDELKEEKKGLEKLKEEMKKQIYSKEYDFLEKIKTERNKARNKILDRIDERKIKLEDILPEKGILEMHSTYCSACQAKINTQLNVLQKDIKNEIDNLQDAFSSKVRELIEEIDLTLTATANKYLTYTIDDIENLKKVYLNFLDEQVMVSLEMMPEPITKGWWFVDIGVAKNIVIDQARKHFDKLKSIAIEPCEFLAQKTQDIWATIKEQFEKMVIIPIEKPLEKAEANYKNKEKRKKQIIAEKNDKAKKISELEEKIANLEKESKTLLEGES